MDMRQKKFIDNFFFFSLYFISPFSFRINHLPYFFLSLFLFYFILFYSIFFFDVLLFHFLLQFIFYIVASFSIHAFLIIAVTAGQQLPFPKFEYTNTTKQKLA